MTRLLESFQGYDMASGVVSRCRKDGRGLAQDWWQGLPLNEANTPSPVESERSGFYPTPPPCSRRALAGATSWELLKGTSYLPYLGTPVPSTQNVLAMRWINT